MSVQADDLRLKWTGAAPRARVASPNRGSAAAPLLPSPGGPGAPSSGAESAAARLRLRVLASFVGAALSSSVLQSFPTLEPILLDARPGVGSGLFLGSCEANWTTTGGRVGAAGCHLKAGQPPAYQPVCAGGNASAAACAAVNVTCAWSAAAPQGAIDTCPEALDLAQTLYSVSLGLSTATTLVAGYIYDKKGPRYSGVLGALVCAGCNCLITISLLSPSLNWLSFAAFPLADCAGGLVSLSMWGFTWHYPTHQALIAALFNSSVGLSAYLAVLGGWLVSGPLHMAPTLVSTRDTSQHSRPQALIAVVGMRRCGWCMPRWRCSRR